MIRQLNAREKVLIYIMIVLLLVVGIGMLLIYPAYARASELGELISERQMSADLRKQTMESETEILNNIQDFQAGIDTLSAQYLKPYTNDQLDTYVTGILKKHGLTVDALSIEEVEEDPLSQDQYGAAGAEGNAAGEAQQTDTDGGQDLYAGVRSYVKTRQVRVVVSGNLANFTALADEVQGLSGIRIYDFNLQPAGSGYTLDSTENSAALSMNIGFEIRLYDENAGNASTGGKADQS